MFVWFVRQEACFVSLLSILSIEMALFSAFWRWAIKIISLFCLHLKGTQGKVQNIVAEQNLSEDNASHI